MTYPAATANLVVLWGRWWDHLTKAGVDATITATPLLATGQAGSGSPNLVSLVDQAEIKTAAWSTKPLAASGLWALPLLPTNDAQFGAFGGYRIQAGSEPPFVVEILESTPTMVMSVDMIAALNAARTQSNAAPIGISVNDVAQAVWVRQAAVLQSPAVAPPAGVLTSDQVVNLVAGVRQLPLGGTPGQVPTPKVGGGYEWVAQSGGSAAPSDASTSAKGVARVADGTADDPKMPWGKVTGKPTFSALATSSDAAGLTGLIDDARIPASIARDSETQAAIDALIGGAPGTRDTLKEISDVLNADEGALAALTTIVGGKADKLTQRTVAVTAASSAGDKVAAPNEIVPLDTSGGTFTFAGPPAGAVYWGWRWKAGTAANAPTIAAPNGYTINGAASLIPGLAPAGSSGELVVYELFGTDYQPVGGFKPQTALRVDTDARYQPVVTVSAAKGDGITDDTATINALLTAAGADAVVRGVPGRNYLISSPLITRAGGRQTLDMTGCTVTLAVGSNTNMLRTAAAAAQASVSDAVTVAGSTVVSTALVATVGQQVSVAAAGPNGAPLYGTVTAVGAGALTLSAPAVAAVSAAVVSVYTRDSDVTIIGGTWNRQANSGGGIGMHILLLRRCDGVTVRGARFLSSAGKYALSVGDCTNITAETLRFATASDGVHISGPAKGVQVTNLYGTTGDDMLALTGTDWATYCDTYGDISDVVATGLYPQGALAAFKLISGTGSKVARVSVRGIYGASQIRPIAIIDDITGPTDVRDLRIADVSCMPSAANENLVRLYPTAGRNIIIENLHWEGPITSTSAALVAVQNAALIKHLTLRDLHLHGAQDGVDFVRVTGTAAVQRLNIDGAFTQDGPTNCHLLSVASGCTVSHADLRRANLIYAGSGTTGSLVVGGGNYERIALTNVYSQGGNGVRITRSTSSIRVYIRFTDVYLAGGGTGGYAVQGSQPMDIDFNGGDMGISNTIVALVGTGASADVRGYTRNSRTKIGIGRDGTQTIRLHSFDLQADVSVLVKSAGDMAFNTNSSLACGVGPVVCDGTSWKHLFTGATY